MKHVKQRIESYIMQPNEEHLGNSTFYSSLVKAIQQTVNILY